MSTLTVAQKDLKAVRRSRTLWAVAVTLGIIVLLMAYTLEGAQQTSTRAVQSLFQALTLLLAILWPLVAVTANYMAIAGEREGGGIKFLLSLPNTRRDVFAGKLLSRLGVVAAGAGFLYLAATSMALSKHGVFPVVAIVGTLLLTIVYGSVFVNIAIAVSASAASRSKAIGGALASYIGLVILYVIPVLQVSSIVRGIHTTLLGMAPNPDLYNAVQYTSPYLAYRKAVNLVVPTDLENRLFLDSARNVQQGSTGAPGRQEAMANPDLPVYLTDEFSLVILAFWLVVPLFLGYRAFQRADLE